MLSQSAPSKDDSEEHSAEARSNTENKFQFDKFTFLFPVLLLIDFMNSSAFEKDSSNIYSCHEEHTKEIEGSSLNNGDLDLDRSVIRPVVDLLSAATTTKINISHGKRVLSEESSSEK